MRPDPRTGQVWRHRNGTARKVKSIDFMDVDGKFTILAVRWQRMDSLPGRHYGSCSPLTWDRWVRNATQVALSMTLYVLHGNIFGKPSLGIIWAADEDLAMRLMRSTSPNFRCQPDISEHDCIIEVMSNGDEPPRHEPLIVLG
jgi:hypothetical protein